MNRGSEVLVVKDCLVEFERLRQILERHNYKISVKKSENSAADLSERHLAEAKFRESRNWLQAIFAAPRRATTRKKNGRISPTAKRERQTEEQKISESHEWLRAIFDASRDGIVVEDAGKIVFINDSYVRMLGYDAPDELIEMALAEILSPDDVERMREFGEARLRGEQSPFVYEFRSKRKDGSLIDLEASVSTYAIAGKTYIITAVRDLTGHKRAAQLIQESEQRFRMLGESILHQVWTAKPDGTLDYVNARTLEYLGVTKEETLTKIWQDAIHPDDLPVCIERWEKSLRTGAHYEVEFRMRDARGNYRWYLGRATGGLDADGQIFKWFGTNTEINDRKTAEQLLRQSEERFQLVARATNDVLWEWDIATDHIWLNEGMQTVFGYTVDQIENRYEFWRDGIHPEDLKEIQRGIYQFLDGDEEIWTGEYRYARADGEYVTVVDRRILVRDEQGKPLRMLGSIRDISENKQAEQLLVESENRLRQSQKMEAIGTLTGGVAHDFNNLLTAILGNSQLALRDVSEGDPLHRRLMEIRGAGNRAAVLTRQLLAFSRRQHLERKVINLNDSICDITKLIQRIIGEDIEVAVKCSGNLATVFADAAQIEQVVMNMAVNARDAMPAGGKLIIETNNVVLDQSYCRQYPYVQPGNYVQIRVSDDGCGMSEETKARIFEPFYTTKEIGKGTGLGLSMAYGIVKQHDGHINVYSEVGYGTSFKVFLPVSAEAAAAEQATIQPALFGGSETILVAEDETALRDLAKDVLEASGYTVLLAKNGEEAVKVYRENRERIDLLLLDVVMPRMGGAEVFEQIRASGGDLPVIFMTGYSSETVQNRFVKQYELFVGSETTIVQKPYSVELIERKIREVLNGHSKSVQETVGNVKKPKTNRKSY